MDILEQQAIEHECQRLAVQFTQIIDMGKSSEVADLFATDGQFDVPGMLLENPEAIRALFAKREGSGKISKHVCTNILIDVINESEAKGVCYMTLYKYEGEPVEGPAPLDGPFYVGHYIDKYIKENDQWKFAHRKAEMVLVKK